MANWFPMAVKDGTHSWIMHLPEGSISLWDGLRGWFIANFQGTRNRALTVNDLRRVKQQPGNTFCKYIQRFTNVHLKISKASDEAIISAFTEGVAGVKMSEELAIHDDLCSALEMFNLADRCAKAEEGRLSLLKHPNVHPEDKNAKTKEAKRKGPTVLAAEPELKRGRDHDKPPKDTCPFCVLHNVHTHNTNDW
ncbi:uncharacterized protein [Aegilops tauschii subsp. strangulata]|uniref:uncharacterized protein n=1 Tax=Aegilops tauschii subsp. strangulata TaxID=200361 RepID=UPI003CC888FC